VNTAPPLAPLAGATWDVAVVGAGPAGSLAARALALRSLSVLLVERATFPRDKVCGGCLGPRGLAALRAEGLPAPPVASLPLARVSLCCAGRTLELPAPGLLAVSRADLDAALASAAADAGVTLLQATSAEPDGLLADARALRLRRGGETLQVRARVVLAADGLASRFVAGRSARGARVGAGVLLPEDAADLPAGTLAMAVGRGGYVGLVRLPDGRLDAAAALDPRAVAERGAGALMLDILRTASAPAPAALLAAAVRVTPPLTRRPARPAGARLLALGDAAGCVEPFTGEGLTWALLAARAVVPLAERGARAWDAGVGAAWVRVHRDLVRHPQRLCAGLAAWLRHPLLVRGGLSLAARRPALARGVLARLGAGATP